MTTEFDAMLERARALGPLIEEHAERISAERRLTPEVLAGLRASGVFRMPMLAAQDGPELAPVEQIRVLEELCYHDGSVGWVAMICCDGGFYAGLAADPGLVDELYADRDDLTAGWLIPAGRAEVVEGGYRVTGRWSFGSGILHSEHVVGGCLVHRDGVMQFTPDGQPEYVAMFLPTEAITIHDVWQTTGLAGTSSNDYSVDDAFVPEHHTFDVFGDDRGRHPLHSYRGFFFAKMCAVPMGLLRRAIDEFIHVAETKLSMPSFQPVKGEYRVQVALASAQADLDASWGIVERTMGSLWQTALAGERPSLEQRAALARMNVWVAQTARRAIDRLCEEAGTTASMRPNRLERIRRDALMVTHHVVGQERTYAVAGQLTFGIVPPFVFV